MDLNDADLALMKGEKVARAGWDKGTFLFRVAGDSWHLLGTPAKALGSIKLPWICMKRDNHLMPWFALPDDGLANDWEVVP